MEENPIVTEMRLWTEEAKADIEKSAKSIQQRMLSEIKANSPVEDYPSRSGVKYNIIVHRQPPNVPMAVRQRAKNQVGSFQKGWTTVTFDNKAKTTTIYGVRNRQYQLTHLLNFNHAHFSHGRITGEVKGSGFVDEVQDTGVKELDSEIKRILNI